MEIPEKNWYVNIDGTIHEASGETVDKWIWDGTILSHHTVSRGGLRWLEAGKVPQFARHFASPADPSEDTGEIGPGPAEARTAVYQEQILTGDDLPTPLGLKISMGSAIALAAALLLGYLWAFQLTSPPSRASLTESPEMRALQTRYDTEKKRLEDIQLSQKVFLEPLLQQQTAPKLTYRPERGLNCDVTSEGYNGGTGRYNKCNEPYEQSLETAKALVKKVQEAKQRKEFDMNGQVITSIDKSMETLDLKLEADQKQTVIDLQKADTRSRFYRTFVLLFLALAGLNIVRLTLFPLKKDSLPAGGMNSLSVKS